jgi:hypothetical protein
VQSILASFVSRITLLESRCFIISNKEKLATPQGFPVIHVILIKSLRSVFPSSASGGSSGAFLYSIHSPSYFARHFHTRHCTVYVYHSQWFHPNVASTSFELQVHHLISVTANPFLKASLLHFFIPSRWFLALIKLFVPTENARLMLQTVPPA